MIVIFLFNFCTNSVKKEGENHSLVSSNAEGYLYYLNSDTINVISLDNRKTIKYKFISSLHGPPHISPDGRKLLYNRKEKVNDTLVFYNMYFLDIANGNTKLIGPGYGGRWSYDSKHFCIFMDDTLSFYEYPSLSKIKSFRYKDGWRLCSIDWTPHNNIIVFAYNRNNKSDTRLFILNPVTLDIIREEKMPGMFTKQFVSISDSVFLCCAQCEKCSDKLQNLWHLLKVDLSKKDIFTHLPVKVWGSETIALGGNSREYVFYNDLKKNSIVITPVEKPDSGVVILSSRVSLIGWSKNCIVNNNY